MPYFASLMSVLQVLNYTLMILLISGTIVVSPAHFIIYMFQLGKTVRDIVVYAVKCHSEGFLRYSAGILVMDRLTYDRIQR